MNQQKDNGNYVESIFFSLLFFVNADKNYVHHHFKITANQRSLTVTSFVIAEKFRRMVNMTA